VTLLSKRLLLGILLRRALRQGSSSLLGLTLIPVVLQISGCGIVYHLNFPALAITGQPADQTVEAGQQAIFTVAASGSMPLTYQWLKNGVAISGATNPSYVTPATTIADSGSSFTVTASNGSKEITSSPAALTVTAANTGGVSFVASDGDDSNTGTIDRPYRTIQHCATSVSQGWTCEVRAGTYRETVTPNSGVTILAYNHEPVTIDGSDPVTGWSLYQGSIYKANVTLSADDTNQIFVGSDMMTEARWPNGDDLFHVNWATAQRGTDANHLVDRSLPSGNLTGTKIHLWSGFDPFGHETGIVTASQSGEISIDVGDTGICPVICPAEGGLYYLFGALSLLDTEREWFYDPNLTTLFFMAPGKVDPNTIDVRSKRRQYAFDLRGKSGVTIRNINLFASTIVTDAISANNTLDTINARYVSHFTSLWSAAADFGILLVHQFDSGIVLNGTGNSLQNSIISISAGAGVVLDGNHNTARNNLIQNVDYIGDYASGVDLVGENNVVQHNTITGAGRFGIYIYNAIGQDISYNNVFNGMMLSEDGGEIYACCLQTALGTELHHNWVHDTAPEVLVSTKTFPLAGIYIDNDSSGFVVDQNVVWNNHVDNILINGQALSPPNNNNIHNNTIPDASSNAFIMIHSVLDCTSTHVVDNLVFVDVRVKLEGATGDATTPCTLSNNSSFAPGATEMTPTTAVGCNFDGCSSLPPLVQ
jgi:Right handed beta helix region